MSANACKHMKKLGLISTVYKSLPFLSCVKDTSLIISLCTNSLVVSVGVGRAGNRASCSWYIIQGADLPGLYWVREYRTDSKCCVSLSKVFEYGFFPPLDGHQAVKNSVKLYVWAPLLMCLSWHWPRLPHWCPEGSREECERKKWWYSDSSSGEQKATLT